MPRQLSAFVLLLAACAPRLQPDPVTEAVGLAITNVNVVEVDLGRVISRQTVIISGNRIHAVGSAAQLRIPSGVHIVDGRGRYLMPGLIDTHLHIAWAFGTDDLEPLLHTVLANGVTTIRDAAGIGQERVLAEHAQRVERGELLSPRLFVSGTVSHRSFDRHGVSNISELVRTLSGVGVHGLKILRGLSDEDLPVILQEAGRAGLPVYGHTYDFGRTAGDEEYTMAAVRLGVAGVMHVQGIPQLGPAGDPRPLPAAPRFGADNWQEWWLYAASRWVYSDTAAENALIDTMVARGVWLEPTLLSEEWVTAPARFRAVWEERRIPGSFEETRGGFPDYSEPDLTLYVEAYARMKDFVRRFANAGGTVIAGTDCLPACGFGLQDELGLLVEAGLSPAAALRAGTLNAARALDWDDRLGTVEAGKLADLLLLEANPLHNVLNTRKITAVVAGGRYLEPSALRPDP